MRKEIPFYPNTDDNLHCVPAVFLSLYDYFFDEKLTWEQIDSILKIEELGNKGREMLDLVAFMLLDVRLKNGRHVEASLQLRK